MVFHWSLSDSKSLQVSRTLLRILADLNNARVWMVSTRPLIYKSSSPFTNPLVTLPSAPITISISVTYYYCCCCCCCCSCCWRKKRYTRCIQKKISMETKALFTQSKIKDKGNVNFLHDSLLAIPSSFTLVEEQFSCRVYEWCRRSFN